MADRLDSAVATRARDWDHVDPAVPRMAGMQAWRLIRQGRMSLQVAFRWGVILFENRQPLFGITHRDLEQNSALFQLDG